MNATKRALGCFILVLIFVVVAEPQRATAGIAEYELCMVRTIPEAQLANFIFACSTVAGDRSLPDDMRSDAFFRRGIACYKP